MITPVRETMNCPSMYDVDRGTHVTLDVYLGDFVRLFDELLLKLKLVCDILKCLNMLEKIHINFSGNLKIKKLQKRKD